LNGGEEARVERRRNKEGIRVLGSNLSIFGHKRIEKFHRFVGLCQT
jgi:hypothetical protein